tara:strand:- start:150 stop:395 length:246 start_codon:yes stop_codon:yes gene_type:complete
MSMDEIMEKYPPLITYGHTLYSDNTLVKRYQFSFDELDEFTEVWNLVRGKENCQGCLKTLSIKFREYVDFDEYLDIKLGDE